MINSNITLAITVIISITCIQQMNAGDKELAVPTQQISPYDQARETELKQIIDEKTGRYYNSLLCECRINKSKIRCTRADTYRLLTLSSLCIPIGIGAAISVATGSPDPLVIGCAPSLACLRTCYLLNNHRKIAHKEKDELKTNPTSIELKQIINQETGRWYNAPICKLCNGCSCTRIDLQKAAIIGHGCIPACAGITASAATYSWIPLGAGGIASLLCLIGCNHCAAPYEIAREEKAELARMKQLKES